MTDVSASDTEISDDAIITVRPKGRDVSLAAHVVRMMAHFSLTPTIRQQKEHDSGVFALACVTGDPLNGVDFSTGRYNVDAGLALFANIPLARTMLADLSPGRVVATLPDVSTPLLGVRVPSGGRNHFMVRASLPAGGAEPLYASMLTETGPVALHGLTDLHNIFPVGAVALVNTLSLETQC
jgi:hypothetical protein